MTNKQKFNGYFTGLKQDGLVFCSAIHEHKNSKISIIDTGIDYYGNAEEDLESYVEDLNKTEETPITIVRKPFECDFYPFKIKTAY